LGAFVVVLTVAGCGSQGSSQDASPGSSTDISEAAWTNGEWPFTVPRGILGCTKLQSITFNVNGTLYGVNGTAIDHGNQPVDPIWKTASLGPRVDLGPHDPEGPQSL
jgi:hypothetical protein